MRRIVGILFAVALLLAAGTAAARSDWVQQRTPTPKAPTDVGGSQDPAAGPTEVTDGPLGQMLAKQAFAIPELGALGSPMSTDFSEGGVEAAVVTFKAPDGALVDVVSQQLSEPLTVDAVGPPDITLLQPGPNGEEIIIKETDHVLQVIAVDEEGWMVNIVVNRTSSENPRERSVHTEWSAETVRTWAVELLEASNGS